MALGHEIDKEMIINTRVLCGDVYTDGNVPWSRYSWECPTPEIQTGVCKYTQELNVYTSRKYTDGKIFKRLMYI